VRGHTLVELLVASAAALLVILVLYTALSHYSRAYAREDDVLARSRLGQVIFGLLRDDICRADGGIDVPDIEELLPERVLEEAGWTAGRVALLRSWRVGRNRVNAYVSDTDTHPYLSRAYPYRERWELTMVDGKQVVRPGPDSPSYTDGAPPSTIWSKPQSRWIGPSGTSTAIIHVPDPSPVRRSDFILVRKVAGGRPALHLWAYHRDRTPRWPAGTLLRWTPGTGLANLAPAEPIDFEFHLDFDWAYWDAQPPARPDPWLLMSKAMATVQLRFTRPRRGMGIDPGVTLQSSLIVGP
jgi:hypothetical protein